MEMLLFKNNHIYSLIFKFVQAISAVGKTTLDAFTLHHFAIYIYIYSKNNFNAIYVLA